MQQKDKLESTERRFESAREFGKQYSEVIASVLGKVDSEISQEALDPKIRQFATRAGEFQAEQEQRQSERQLDAHGLLSQAFKSDAQQKLLEDHSGYRMERLSKGIFAVFVSPGLHKQLRPGADATAVTVRNGVSFIYIPEYADEGSQSRNLAENVPHETHHLVWAAAGGSEIFPSKEFDPDFRRSFELFQDELIARASSNGALAGYHHLGGLRPDERTAMEKENPGKADAIIEKVAQLNDTLQELNTLLARSEKVTKKDLIKGIAESGTFSQLEAHLQREKALIESMPLKPAQDNSGWGVVSV